MALSCLAKSRLLFYALSLYPLHAARASAESRPFAVCSGCVAHAVELKFSGIIDALYCAILCNGRNTDPPQLCRSLLLPCDTLSPASVVVTILCPLPGVSALMLSHLTVGTRLWRACGRSMTISKVGVLHIRVDFVRVSFMMTQIARGVVVTTGGVRNARHIRTLPLYHGDISTPSLSRKANFQFFFVVATH